MLLDFKTTMTLLMVALVTAISFIGYMNNRIR